MLGLFYRAADALRRRSAGTGDGSAGEDLAHRYLRRRGCTVVARNYRARSGAGEIDLVVWDGETLAFVEVKTRGTQDFGEPEAAVDEEKRAKIQRAAREYARRTGVEWEKTRFDVVSVVLKGGPHVEWIKDAFGLEAGS